MSVQIRSTIILTDSGSATLTVAPREGRETDPEPYLITTASGEGVKASEADLRELAAAIVDELLPQAPPAG